MIQKQILKSSEMWHHVPGLSPDPVPSNSGSSSPKIWMASPWGRTDQCHILDDLNLLQHCHKNLKSCYTAGLKKWTLSIHQTQNTKTQPMCPQHNIYTNKCMDICIPSCECRPFRMPPSAKLKTLPIVTHRPDSGPYTLSQTSVDRNLGQ
jgi:hypothetical protein